MKLGVYRPYEPENGDERQDTDPDFERVALYDFETEDWSETSHGHIVSSTSPHPTPEEIKVRFDIDQNAVDTGVRTVQWMEDQEATVRVTEPEFSAQRGREIREERDTLAPTEAERQYMREEGVVVYPDEYDPSEQDRQFHAEQNETIISESEWDFDFASQFDFDFHTETP